MQPGHYRSSTTNDHWSISIFLFCFVSAYSNPKYYWPLDYKIEALEINTNENPIIQGSAKFQIIGPANGYLSFPIQTSSAKLGSYNSSCLLNPSKCFGGITIAFWVRTSKVDPLKEGVRNEVDLFTVTALNADVVKIKNVFQNGKSDSKWFVSPCWNMNVTVLYCS